MRKLTIKRTKSIVGAIAKLKIYIEDSQSGELTIHDTPCRKIGELKSGEEKTFQIEETAAKVFVIADKLTKDYCNDYYQLPEGQEDIVLSGKNKYNPATGNAFRFDNNPSEGIATHRKRGMRKGLLVLMIAAILGGIFGYVVTTGALAGNASKPKTFSSHGMTITLTKGFKETEIENQTVAYDSKNVAVFALKEKFTLVDGFENYTLAQYANVVMQANKLSSSKVKTENGLTWFEYEWENPETQDVYRYFAYVYKADDAFWLIQFAAKKENAEQLAPKIEQWAKSVSFTK